MRQSFDERVARWMRRSNPGYLGGRSESVGPPILPQAALETFKMPFSLSGVQVLVLTGASMALDTSVETLLTYSQGCQSPGQLFVTPPANGGTTAIIQREGLFLVTANIFWDLNADGTRAIRFDAGTGSLSAFSVDYADTNLASSQAIEGPAHSITQVHWYEEGDGVAVEAFQTSGISLDAQHYQLSIVQLTATVPEVVTLA